MRRHECVTRVVTRRAHPRVRIQPRRSQLHRVVHTGPADSIHRRIDLPRFFAGLSPDGRKIAFLRQPAPEHARDRQ